MMLCLMAVLRLQSAENPQESSMSEQDRKLQVCFEGVLQRQALLRHLERVLNQRAYWVLNEFVPQGIQYGDPVSRQGGMTVVDWLKDLEKEAKKLQTSLHIFREKEDKIAKLWYQELKELDGEEDEKTKFWHQMLQEKAEKRDKCRNQGLKELEGEEDERAKFWHQSDKKYFNPFRLDRRGQHGFGKDEVDISLCVQDCFQGLRNAFENLCCLLPQVCKAPDFKGLIDVFSTFKECFKEYQFVQEKQCVEFKVLEDFFNKGPFSPYALSVVTSSRFVTIEFYCFYATQKKGHMNQYFVYFLDALERVKESGRSVVQKKEQVQDSFRATKTTRLSHFLRHRKEYTLL
ncbi:MAG: hypothetical protein OXC30_03000 [Alphaproteobacteria bacterium]|nr:hypothetical protein [Alphaproteobacteria bacterium]